MKQRITLKQLLIATLCCLLMTAVQILFNYFSEVHWISPSDFKTYFYWIIVLLGWSIYFLDRFRDHKKHK